MIKWVMDRLEFDGLTREEAFAAAGGSSALGGFLGGTAGSLLGSIGDLFSGDTTGGDQIVAPTKMETTTSVGGQLSKAKEANTDATSGESAVNKKKLGTRGLQIPLTSSTSNTTASSPSSTGVQL